MTLWGPFGCGILLASRQLGFGESAQIRMVDFFFCDLKESVPDEGGTDALST